jgi:hypothetical protein
LILLSVIAISGRRLLGSRIFKWKKFLINKRIDLLISPSYSLLIQQIRSTTVPLFLKGYHHLTYFWMYNSNCQSGQSSCIGKIMQLDLLDTFTIIEHNTITKMKNSKKKFFFPQSRKNHFSTNNWSYWIVLFLITLYSTRAFLSFV